MKINNKMILNKGVERMELKIVRGFDGIVTVTFNNEHGFELRDGLGIRIITRGAEVTDVRIINDISDRFGINIGYDREIIKEMNKEEKEELYMGIAIYLNEEKYEYIQVTMLRNIIRYYCMKKCQWTKKYYKCISCTESAKSIQKTFNIKMPTKYVCGCRIAKEQRVCGVIECDKCEEMKEHEKHCKVNKKYNIYKKCMMLMKIKISDNEDG